MIVVVAGRGRKAGKTSVATGIVASLADLQWTAIKISRHRHGAIWGVTEEREVGATDTGRYLAAGARRAFWIRASGAQMSAAAADVRRIAAESGHTIIESNSILRHLKPDLTIVVLDASTKGWKPSALEAIKAADAAIFTSPAVIPPIAGITLFQAQPPQYVTPAIADFVRAWLADDSSA